MNLSFLLAMLLSFQVSASVFSQQRVSLKLKNLSLEKVFNIIEKNSSYRFAYSSVDMPKATISSVDADNMLVTELLDKILKGTNLVFSVSEGGLITISELTAEQPVKITGVVRDSSGAPLPSVAVRVKGIAGMGTSTAVDGTFSLNVRRGATIVVSLIGFGSKEFVVGNANTYTVTLTESVSTLDAVVVQAYGTTSKRKTTTAIATLDMSNVAPIPVQSINDAVAGRIPGVLVTTDNGAPGTKSQISIRGGLTPLFVIDNVIRSANDFSNLNPNDIESYSVLKDAGATALYGVSAANGVIVVTTKRGKEGTAAINYSYNQIFSRPTTFPTKLSSYDQTVARNRLWADEGQGVYRSPEDTEKYRDGSDPMNFPNTDWQKLALRDYAKEMRHDLSLTAGSKLLTYYAGLSYYDQGSILRTNTNYNKRTTYRLNTTSNFDNLHLKVTAGIDGFVEQNSQPYSGFEAVYGWIRNRNSAELAYNEFGLPSTAADNPVRNLNSGYARKLDKILNTNIGVEYAAPFLDGLKFKVNGAYTTYNNQRKNWSYLLPSYAIGSTTPINAGPPTLNVSQGQGATTTLQGYITYTKTFGDHAIDFTGVYEEQRGDNSSVSGSRTNYQIIFDQFAAGPLADATAGGGEGNQRRAALVGRLNYSFKSRYSVEASVRRDGDYIFPPGNQWGTFYAGSANYVISEEPFMKSLKDKHVFDFLKLRGSWGILGDKIDLFSGQEIAAFQYVPSYSINSLGYVVDGKVVQTTSEPGQLPANRYSWQKINSRDLAIEFSSLNNRLSGTFDWFYTRRTGFVTGDPRFSSTLGIGLPNINFEDAAYRTEGYDFNVSWTNNGRVFNYKIGFNFTRQNTLWERYPTEFDAALMNPYTRTSGTQGGFLTTGYQNLGFFTDNSQLLNGARRISSTNVVAGDLHYADINGDGKIDGSDFIRIGSNTKPRTNYGLTLDLSYKGFSFNTVVQGAGNRDRYLGAQVQGNNPQNLLAYGFQTDYWRPDNTGASFPRATTNSSVNGNNNFTSSDFWLLKSKYVRWKYVQLGYDFKNNLLKNSPFRQLRLFVSATNLLTSSKSMDFYIDPESNVENGGYPVQKTYAIGLNVGF